MSIIDKPIVEHVVSKVEREFPAGRARVHRPVARSIRKAEHDRLHRLRAVILLDGTVRRTNLTAALDRSLLELPLQHDRILLDLWRDEIGLLLSGLELTSVPTRVIVGRTSRAPKMRERDHAARMSAESDPSELRGTGGVLRDLAEAYDDDDVLLVANAAQVLVEPLTAIAVEAAQRGGDVTVVANADGTPTSILLMSCQALRDLPTVGFIDLKEQGLPLMAKRHDVRVQCRASAAGMPIRTPQDYLNSLKAYHRLQAGESPRNQAFDERWRRRFSIVEPGAVVAEDADLHNAVVLRGGRVESGALVANSIVCGGGVVHRREQVIERLVDSTGRKPFDKDPR
jgi:mannose-1-phosphate guanylyltransferase